MVDRYSYDIDLHWYYWKNAITKVLKEVIPKVFIKASTPPWINGKVKHYSNLKKNARFKAIKTNIEKHWNEYKKLNNMLKNLVRKKYKNYINDTFDGLHFNPKRFWNLVKVKGHKMGLPMEMCFEDTIFTDSESKA